MEALGPFLPQQPKVENPYKQSFFRFLTECVWTVDEARAGVVRKWPSGRGKDGKSWDDLWLDYEELLLTRRLTMFEKSRRVMASWTVCAFDIWLAAGGQDERWQFQDPDGEVHKPLMESTGNRVIILAAQKAQGEFGSEWFIAKRVKGVLDGCEAHGIRDKWPDWPEWTHKQGVLENSIGSRIVGVPQGSNQLRGGGITQIHAEEIAFWPQAKASIGGAVPTLSGVAHLVGLTTPQIGTYAEEIRDGKAGGSGERSSRRTSEEDEDVARRHIQRGRVLTWVDHASGWCVPRASWETVPDYPIDVMRAGMDEATQRQELDLDWTASSGKRVYPAFDPAVNVSDSLLPFDPSQPLVLGWDTGGSAWTGTPAVVAMQLSVHGQLLVYGSYSPPEDETVGILDFAWEVYEWLTGLIVGPLGLTLDDIEIHHYGDPAGKLTPSVGIAMSRGKERQTCYEIIRSGERKVIGHDEYGDAVLELVRSPGWIVEDGEGGLAKRMEALRSRLPPHKTHGGYAPLVVDPRAKDIQKGFLGGYHYHQRQDGRFELDPMKNWFSHLMNALEYGNSRLAWAMPNRDEVYERQPGLDDYSGTATGVGSRRSRR